MHTLLWKYSTMFYLGARQRRSLPTLESDFKSSELSGVGRSGAEGGPSHLGASERAKQISQIDQRGPKIVIIKGLFCSPKKTSSLIPEPKVGYLRTISPNNNPSSRSSAAANFQGFGNSERILSAVPELKEAHLERRTVMKSRKERSG